MEEFCRIIGSANTVASLEPNATSYPKFSDTMKDSQMDDRKAAIKQNLKLYEIGNILSDLPEIPKASILIPLLIKNGEIHVLFTVRSLELRSGAGDVCFPGGKFDPKDHNEIDTALREAEEEIGLARSQVDVVCKLCPVIAKKPLLVTPVVAFIEDSFKAQPNPAEVSDVFTVPLNYFLSQSGHSSFSVAGITGEIHSFRYQDPDSRISFTIWGLTALIAILTAVLAFRRKPSFEIAFDAKDPRPYFQSRLSLHKSKM
ncbi:hypothetical protein GJAV_G00247410 [Gymnothorax javanicus]|nr:hypothetical protein GJAV_G00247410 [Gymnothorax javanicus]